MGDITDEFGPGGWQFTPAVADVFDGHVRASVPHYDVFQDLVAAAADWLVPDGGVVADLGASTGTTVDGIRRRHPTRSFTAHLYDNQPAMLNQAKAKTVDGPGATEYHCTDITAGPYAHSAADLTMALFVLQFLPIPARRDTLSLARRHAAPGGALLIAEKVRAADPVWAEIGIDLSHDWKADHGISPDAIRAKALQLRGVLRPVDLPTLACLVLDAGWTNPEVIFKWHNWVLMGATTPA